MITNLNRCSTGTISFQGITPMDDCVTHVFGPFCYLCPRFIPPLSPSRYRALFQVVYPGSGRGKLIWDIGPGVPLPLVAHPWLFSFRPSGPSVPDRCAHKGNR